MVNVHMFHVFWGTRLSFDIDVMYLIEIQFLHFLPDKNLSLLFSSCNDQSGLNHKIFIFLGMTTYCFLLVGGTTSFK